MAEGRDPVQYKLFSFNFVSHVTRHFLLFQSSYIACVQYIHISVMKTASLDNDDNAI